MKELAENRTSSRYYGFAVRDYLILAHLPKEKNLAVLEIGVGLASMADKLIGSVNEYCGVDIAGDLIDYLKQLYKNVSEVSWLCLDACQDSPVFDKQFDVVFSADTLEHVNNPAGFFSFIKKHLKPEGVVLLTFPNESGKKHHGLTWFVNKEELIRMVERAGLKLEVLLEVKPSGWHKFIKGVFWNFPKSLLLKNKDLPQTFSETNAFNLVRSAGLKTQLLAFYGQAITKLVIMFSPYYYEIVKDKISDKILLIRLKHRS